MELNAEQQEFVESLERWLKERRDSYRGPSSGRPSMMCFDAIDELLDEVRDNAVMGKLPWTV